VEASPTAPTAPTASSAADQPTGQIRGRIQVVANALTNVAAALGIGGTSTDPGPGGPLGRLLELAYVFRREVTRLVLNHAPVATALTPKPQDVVGAIFGQIGVEDYEADAVTYAVGRAPLHGTVAVNKYTGEYLYTPDFDDAAEGVADSFTIVVDDGRRSLFGLDGAGLLGLSLFGTGRTVVPVSVSVAATAPVSNGRFDLINYSLFPVKVTGIDHASGGGAIESGIAVGDIVYPGEDRAIVITGGSGTAIIHLQSVGYPDVGELAPNEGYEYTVGFTSNFLIANATFCDSSGGGRCAATQPSTAYLMDQPFQGPIDIKQPALQAVILQKVCAEGSRASCKFTATSTQATLADGVTYGDSIRNETDIVQSVSFSDSKSVTTTDTLSVSGKLSKKLIFDINAEISVTAQRAVAQSRTFTRTVTENAQPRRVTTEYWRAPIVKSTGDFTITLGETVVTIRDITFVVPDGDENHFGQFNPVATPL
jgi:hypothetical protein